MSDILPRAAETALALVDHQTPGLRADQRAEKAKKVMAGLLDALGLGADDAALQGEIYRAMRSGKVKP